MTHFYFWSFPWGTPGLYSRAWGVLNGSLCLTVLSRRAACFLFLAGCTAEVPARLHQSLPGQTERAGAKGTGEEGAGRLGGPAVGRRSQAEESPRRPGHLSER